MRCSSVLVFVLVLVYAVQYLEEVQTLPDLSLIDRKTNQLEGFSSFSNDAGIGKMLK